MAVKQQISQQTGQKQQLKLSQQQLLLSTLLESSIVELEEKVKNEIEANPALEEAEPYSSASTDANSVEDFEKGGDDYSGDAQEDYIGDAQDDYSGETPDRDDPYSMQVEYDSDDAPYSPSDGVQMDIPQEYNSFYAEGESLTEYLDNQIETSSASAEQRKICHYIVGSLDAEGFLQDDLQKMADDLNIYQGVEVTISELLEAVLIVQSLDPAGVCARSVNECLRLQAERKMTGHFSEDFIPRCAVAILDEYFDDFTAHRDEKIQKRLEVERDIEGEFEHITKDEYVAAKDFIQGLNPHPCHIYTETTLVRGFDSITPDFYYDSQSDRLTVSSGRIPALKVSGEYARMLEVERQKKHDGKQEKNEAELFLQDRITSAQQFIDAINQRNIILSKVMTAIIKVQREFFRGGCDDSLLQPLTMKQIAETVGCDISTVSRVANSKYIDVDHQYTFRIKHFFSEKITTKSGETVSNKMIMETIRSLVESEDRTSPLTDDAISAILNKQGYNVARRTVAKYRTAMGIGSTRDRSESN